MHILTFTVIFFRASLYHNIIISAVVGFPLSVEGGSARSLEQGGDTMTGCWKAVHKMAKGKGKAGLTPLRSLPTGFSERR